ncbi:MAG: ABC transporter substrate-binding protein [Gammaproteobacteria bacterium]|nr:MAG: ABC transporter substrate-binding protein [Gammaproteobacteria bacterium]
MTNAANLTAMVTVTLRSGLLALVLVLGQALADEPRYGGDLNVGTVNITLSALSWDPADWAWKSPHDAGMIREQLFAGDLDLAVSRGGPFPFLSDAYLPPESIRGELAESWAWEDPSTLVIELRRGIMFHDKPGVMAARELDAEDVVFTFELMRDSPRKIPTYFDHIASVEARDSHTVVFRFSEYNAEWMYRFGYGYYSSIVPRETADLDRRDWRNVTGTGPFRLTRYIRGNSQVHERVDSYWDTETIDGTEYEIPFVDKVIYRIIKDEATYLSALRTGRLDILESIRWIAVDHLRKTSPELQWSRRLSNTGSFMALRIDREPFDDVRVRRALNLAVNQREIAELFYGGHAELMAYPQHPDYGDYFQPLEDMPASVQELFDYDPEKAKALLAEAGYPDGFEFRVQVCACSPTLMDLVPLLEDYLAQVGVRMRIQPMEYGAFLSAMTTRTHSPGYLMGSGHVNPTTTLRKSFVSGQTWNPSMYSDPDFDRRMREVYQMRDESARIDAIRQMTVDILDEAPYIWLPTEHVYTAWWPWVRNYGGELRVGAVRPGPIYARIWIDHEMKRRLGFK